MRNITLTSPQRDVKVLSSRCPTDIGLYFIYPKLGLIPLEVYRISFEKLKRITNSVNLPDINL